MRILLILILSLSLPAFAQKQTKGLTPAGGGTSVPEVDDKPMKDAKIKLAQAQGQVERAQDAYNKVVAELRRVALLRAVVARPHIPWLAFGGVIYRSRKQGSGCQEQDDGSSHKRPIP